MNSEYIEREFNANPFQGHLGINDGGAAFPVQVSTLTGLTKYELACIELRIPRTGNEDIDALIREANRRDIAMAVMQGNPATYKELQRLAELSVLHAEALLEELAK